MAAGSLSPGPALGLGDPMLGLADPAPGLADPVLGLADPVLGLADPALGLADPVLGLADPALVFVGCFFFCFHFCSLAWSLRTEDGDFLKVRVFGVRFLVEGPTGIITEILQYWCPFNVSKNILQCVP